MKEFTEAAVVDPPKEGSLVDHLTENVAAYGGSVALRRKTPSGWSDMTFTQFHDEVRAVAKGIAAAGVQPGDRIGVMSSTRYEWTLVDYAIWYAGAVSVPIYETSSAEQVEWCLSDSGAVAVFLEGPRHAAVFQDVREALPNVATAWVFEDGAIAALKAAGAVVGDDDLDARRATLTPESIATIIYTSGTTGRPKGCVLSHGNLMFEVDAVVKGMPNVFTAEGSTLLFLPIAHVFGRVIELGCIRARVTLGHTDITNAVADMGDFHPTFLLAVPRVFEKIYNGARQVARDGGKGAIFERGASVAIEYSQALDKGGPSLLLRVQHIVFDRLLYGKLRGKMGGEVAYAVSGGAALGSRLGHFFRGIGINVLEGYGLTETSAAHTVNRPDKVKIGSVGRPVPGSSVRIADDGEILLKGPQVFQGYWNNDQATAEVMEPDGWFHSGDIGELDDQGFLRITGRKKELLVTAGGKNVAPAVLEDRIRSHHLVSQCMVVGDGKPYIAALVTIDVEALPAWKNEAGKPASATVAELAHDADLRSEIQQAVDRANKAVSSAEAIKKFEILPSDWTEEGGQLTPSMKLKRNVVMAEFAKEVEALYS
jgi:long-chain acyl-CoA synthetase